MKSFHLPAKFVPDITSMNCMLKINNNGALKSFGVPVVKFILLCFEFFL